MDEAVRRLRPDHALEAAGYIRVSLERQADGYSPDTQRAAIKRLAAEQGYALTLIEEDHERGSKVTRAGYQKIIEAVRAGAIHAVLVFMFDRWGRDGAEWLMRAHEFERLGVPIISAQEGKDEGGLMRFIRAGMAEEYVRQHAKRIRPNKELSARSGTHMGQTPFGYRREYPPPASNGKRLPGELVEDEATAWIVRELFARYAGGGYSLRGLVDWLNADERIAPPVGKEYWITSSVRDLLHNPTYIGMVRYNHRSVGKYERATAGDEFTVPGRHEALVDVGTFEAVQQRMAAAARRQSYNRRDAAPAAVAVGRSIMRCASCGGPMSLRLKSDGPLYYECAWRRIGKPCTTRSYLAGLGDSAILAQICRLRGAPWTPQAEQRLAGSADTAKAVKLRRALDQEHERLRRHTRRMTLMDDDPTPEQIASFREVSREISARIRALDAQITDLGQRAAQVPDLRGLHARLTRMEIPALVALARDRGAVEELRELAQGLIVSVRIVERRPENHPKWLRAQVEWHSNIHTLIAAGLLQLGPDPEPPAPGPSKQERMREHRRRYHERHREEINAYKREQRRREREQKCAE